MLASHRLMKKYSALRRPCETPWKGGSGTISRAYTRLARLVRHFRLAMTGIITQGHTRNWESQCKDTEGDERA
ncbi:hypothetical protein BDN67DRAFT_792653 [Paxillus ammoniavirescens]|nr:hypothetical protein BDN67DRAFT_792653 [Paxillus ammoniavirescens]